MPKGTCPTVPTPRTSRVPNGRAVSEDRKRVFKTRAFNKDAAKAALSDEELCKAIKAVWEGKADNLGGGVWKKRLDENRDRAIVLAEGRRNWVYTHLFAKSDRGNITPGELAAFKMLAKEFGNLKEPQIKKMLEDKSFVEICNDDCKKT